MKSFKNILKEDKIQMDLKESIYLKSKYTNEYYIKPKDSRTSWDTTLNKSDATVFDSEAEAKKEKEFQAKYSHLNKDAFVVVNESVLKEESSSTERLNRVKKAESIFKNDISWRIKTSLPTILDEINASIENEKKNASREVKPNTFKIKIYIKFLENEIRDLQDACKDLLKLTDD